MLKETTGPPNGAWSGHRKTRCAGSGGLAPRDQTRAGNSPEVVDLAEAKLALQASQNTFSGNFPFWN